MENTEPRFPDATVQLSGEAGNAFLMIGRTLAALKRAGATNAQRDAFIVEATSVDYDHVLITIMQWVNVA